MYLDTSVAAKLYFNEPESDRVTTILAESGSTLVSSELLIAEFHSVASRKLREGLVTRRQRKEAIDAFLAHDQSGSWHLYPVTRETFVAAGELLEKLSGSIGLKTLDAIHLATCMRHSLFPLFTTDRIMLSAARRLKIEIAAGIEEVGIANLVKGS